MGDFAKNFGKGLADGFMKGTGLNTIPNMVKTISKANERFDKFQKKADKTNPEKEKAFALMGLK